MHENRETPSPTVSESGSPAGEGESRTSGMHSSGEGGGKGVNQGERPAGTRGPGTARSSRVTGSEGRAESGQGEEAGTVHYVAAPSDRQSAAGQLLRTET